MTFAMPSVTMPACTFGVPTLVISGSGDPIVSWDSAARTAIYHGAKHVVASDAGHLLHVEQGAERIAHAVLHWLDEMNL
jgi:pimeloyl-ACP methyl ester carboxylesterase